MTYVRPESIPRTVQNVLWVEAVSTDWKASIPKKVWRRVNKERLLLVDKVATYRSKSGREKDDGDNREYHQVFTENSSLLGLGN